jgi:hypothetical protein
MTCSTDLKTLLRWMSADFSNQEQAFANPPLYAHIRVCMRPLPLDFLPGQACLFLEQAYDFMLSQPYRVRVLGFEAKADHIYLKNYTLMDDKAFIGASRNLDLLQTFTPDQVVEMKGCDMTVEWTGNSFKGRIVPGKACRVDWRGQETYLDNEFEVSEKGLTSLDRGFNLETNERVWGSIAGEFYFLRWHDFAEEVLL